MKISRKRKCFAADRQHAGVFVLPVTARRASIRCLPVFNFHQLSEPPPSLCALVERNDVACCSWCCFGCSTVTPTVCSRLREAPRLPASQTGKQVFDSWWVVLCWERPAHLSSNELHETDCFFILHLTLQQKWVLTNCLAADRMCSPLWGGGETTSLNKAFDGGLIIFLIHHFGTPLFCCLYTSVCYYHTI